MSKQGHHETGLKLFLWGALLIGPLPGFITYLSWVDELEQYGYMLPLLVSLAALIFFRWDRRLRMPEGAVSLGLVSLSMTTTLVASLQTSPWLSTVGFAIGVTAWLHSHYGEEGSQRLTYMSLLLLMLVRLPLNLDLTLATRLQQITSTISGYAMDSLGLIHNLRGNVFELRGGKLFVEEACSGVQSLFTILFLASLWIVLMRRPVITAPIYFLAGAFLAVVMNVIRITSVAIAQEWFQTDLAHGTPHEILGWCCLLTAVLLLLSTDRLIRSFFFPIPPDDSGLIGNPFSRLWNWSLSLGVAQEVDSQDLPSTQTPSHASASRVPALATVAIVSAFCLPSFALGYRVVMPDGNAQQSSDRRELLYVPAESPFSGSPYSAFVTDHQSLRNVNSKQLGNHADIWTLVLDGIPLRVAISQPYPEWHDMRKCYEGDGWEVNAFQPSIDIVADSEQQDESTISRQDAEQWSVSYAEFVHESGGFGTLLFCGLTREGNLLSPPMLEFSSLLGTRFKDRSAMGSNIIMLQMWTESQKPLLPDQLDKMLNLFESFRWTVSAGVTGEIAAGANELATGQKTVQN